MASLVATKGNSLLLPNEVDMIETLRTSRDFVKLMRELHYHSSLKHLQDFVEDKEETQSSNIDSSLQLKTF